MTDWREGSFGNLKRFEFVKEVIHASKPGHVLDIGCGTGANLTTPLARAFPQIRFVGVDRDAASVAFARKRERSRNLSFADESALEVEMPFDLVIASEVIEHVENPDGFLQGLKALLTDKGLIVLTLPNGFGPFEFASLIEVLLRLTGLYEILRVLYRFLGSPRGDRSGERCGGVEIQEIPGHDSLAISPHINFFSFAGILRLIASAGLEVVEYRPRTFLCGFGFSNILRGERALAWNARVADALPPGLSSDWMFVLKQGETKPGRPFRRNLIARIRRYLNERRWGLR